MAQSKNTRKAAAPKFTYQERVLHALSSEHKQHKKHSVHVATLNAQVKRHATTNNDKLGPSWKTYVGKAIASLKGQGAVSAMDSHGALSLTPMAKKAVVTARHELSLENDENLSVTEQEALWKRVVAIVTHRESRTPRPSRKSYAASTPTRGDHGPIGKLTKAQLLEKLKDLQMEHDRAKLRDTSPLTDIDDALNAHETERLKSLILHQNNQIQEIRRELEDARHQGATQYDGHSERFMTPEPIQQPTPRTEAARLPDAVVTRRQSGLSPSNEPTPAPSSPGGLDAPALGSGPDGADDDFFSPAGPRVPLARQSSMLDQLKEHQFENEQLTTQLAMQSKDVAAKTVALARLELEVQAARSSHQARISELETSQKAQAGTLSQLQHHSLALAAEKEILESKLLAAQLQISSDVERISSLSSQILQVETEMTAKMQDATETSESTRASLLDQVSALSASKVDLEKKLEATQQEADQMSSTTQALQVALQDAQTAVEGSRIQVVELEAALANVQSVLDLKTKEQEAAEETYRSSLNDTRTALDSANAQVDSLQRDLATKDAQLTLTASQLADALRDGRTYQETIEALSLELTAARARQTQLNAERIAKEEELNAAVSRHDSEMTDVKSKLAVVSEERNQANALSFALESSNKALEVELAQTREVLQTTSLSLETTRSSLKRKESEYEELEGHATALQQDMDLLYEGKARDDQTIDQLKSKCSQLASDAIRQFTQFNSQIASTESSPSPAKRPRYSIA